MNNKVVFIQRILPSYRIPFFFKLKERLTDNCISIYLNYGQEYPGTVPKTCDVDNDWSSKINNKYYQLFGFKLVWQPAIKHIIKADLIIIEQSNSLLINYIVLLLRFLTKKKVAFWGHGRNMQSKTTLSFSERLKRILITKVDWWFAYTNMSVDQVIKSGFPTSKITNVENAIDTSSFKQALQQVDLQKINSIKNELVIESDNILLYCGGMYAEKKIDFLLSACAELKNYVSDLHVIFVGSGPEEDIVIEASNKSAWLHYVGPKFGVDRAPYFRMCKATLMPGAVGLSMVDSFIAGTPLFTCKINTHGPEIDYLENGINGVMTSPNIDDYVESLREYFLSSELQGILKKGCLESAKKYTLENMVNNFSDGIIKCLKGV